jgi:NAD(P)-dependent dehydrogenase (short-subunit alcohol dehydrogenase family)
MSTSNNAVLVLGASSGIGQALLAEAVARGVPAVAVSRQARPVGLDERVHWFEYQTATVADVECSELQMQQTEQVLAELLPRLCQQFQPDLIISCQGLLQQDAVKAEKSLRQLDIKAALSSWWVNYLLPALQLKILLPYLSQQQVRMLVLSAKVGSISDNQLGGWYSYRAAKAALNMLVKTTAIELRRLQPATLLVAVHPGTTATALAAPFLRNLPAGQLQAPASTASRLWTVAAGLTPAQHGCLLHWDGQVLPF